MMILKIHPADLSTETLLAIKNDLDKYGHLQAYRTTYDDLTGFIAARRDEEKKQKLASKRS